MTRSNHGLAPLVEGDSLVPLVEGVAGTGGIVVVTVVGSVFAATQRIHWISFEAFITEAYVQLAATDSTVLCSSLTL